MNETVLAHCACTETRVMLCKTGPTYSVTRTSQLAPLKQTPGSEWITKLRGMMSPQFIHVFSVFGVTVFSQIRWWEITEIEVPLIFFSVQRVVLFSVFIIRIIKMRHSKQLNGRMCCACVRTPPRDSPTAYALRRIYFVYQYEQIFQVTCLLCCLLFGKTSDYQI